MTDAQRRAYARTLTVNILYPWLVATLVGLAVLVAYIAYAFIWRGPLRW